MSESKVSPLEVFLREYLETAGGVWDEVEPQVYDVLLPAGAQVPAGRGNAAVDLRPGVAGAASDGCRGSAGARIRRAGACRGQE